MTNATLSTLMACNNLAGTLDRITNQASALVKADPDQNAVPEVTAALATIQTKLTAAQAAMTAQVQQGS
jgi:hypothetical protein